MHLRRSVQRGHHVHRRKRWWRQFASPIWLLLGAPALLLPLGIAALMDEDAPISMVEQAISALPIPGNAADGADTDRTSRITALGTNTARMPAAMSTTLYRTSARAEAERLGQRDDAPVRARMVDIAALTHELLHPPRLAREDLLVGAYALLVSTPMGSSFGMSLYRDICAAPSEDATYGASLEIPADSGMVVALSDFIPVSSQVSFCPQVSL